MKVIWVPVKATLVVVKSNERGISEVDQSIAFESRPVEQPRPGFGGAKP